MQNKLALILFVIVFTGVSFPVGAAKKNKTGRLKFASQPSTRIKQEGPRFNIGMGLMLLDYSHTNDPKITQLWTQMRGHVSYSVAENIDLEGKSSVGLFALSKSGTSSNLRFLELSGGILFRVAYQSNQGFLSSFGYQYETLLGSKDWGLRNVHGPYGSLAISFSTAKKQSLVFGLGYSFFATDTFFTTKNNEVVFRTNYCWFKQDGHDLHSELEGQIKRLSLNFNNGGVGAYTYSLYFVKAI